jgi:hypothetical protein
MSRGFVLTAMAFVLMVVFASASFGDFTIQGTVTAAGKPVQNAVVGIKTTSFATADADVVVNPSEPYGNRCYFSTDALGQFGPSAPIPAGTYYVGVWADGYGMVEQQVVLDSNKTLEIQLTKAAGVNIAYRKPVFWGPSTDPYSYAKRITDGGRYGGDAGMAVDAAWSNRTRVIDGTHLQDEWRMPGGNWYGVDIPWEPNIWAGYTLRIRHQGSSGFDHEYLIAGNTSDTIQIASGNLIADGVTNGDYYEIVSNTGDHPVYMGVDLGSNSAVNQVVVDFFIWNVPYNYAIMYAADDGTGVRPPIGSAAWHTYYSTENINPFRFAFQGDSGPWEAISNGTATGRWWMIYVTRSSHSWTPGMMFAVREFEVYSATEFLGQVRGVVKNSVTQQPIYNAVVQVQGDTGNAAVTDTEGFYSLVATTTGQMELFADALNYKAKSEVITIPADGTILVKDILLDPRDESSGTIYNGDFEIAGSGSGSADGWEIFINTPGGTDVYGNPYPAPNDDMYVGTRSTGENSTPGGSASGMFASGNRHPNPGVVSIEDHSGDPNWGGTVTSVTSTHMTDTSKNWNPGTWSQYTDWLKITHNGVDHFYRIQSNTGNTITIQSGDMAADGIVPGDPYIILRYNYMFWYQGGMRNTPSRWIPVDQNSMYSFYFKTKRSGDSEHFYGFVWRRADGSEISRAYNWWYWPGGSWTQVINGNVPGRSGFVPMLRMVPPSDAAYIEVEIGYTQWGWNWPNKPVTTWVDDLVVDRIPYSDVSGTITGTVKVGGVPYKGAIVGAKLASKGGYALADADAYAVTDANGKYTISRLVPGSYIVAAWPHVEPSPFNEMYGMSAQQTVTASLGGTTTADFNITTSLSLNVAKTSDPSAVIASENDAAKLQAFDGWRLGGGGWNAVNPGAYLIRDLGSNPPAVDTIVWAGDGSYPTSYTISYSSNGTNYTNAYTTNVGNGGYAYYSWERWEMIKLQTPVTARFWKLTLNTFSQGNCFVREFELYGSANGLPGKISGTVKLAGAPIAGAVVGIKSTPSPTADADYYYTTNSQGRFESVVLRAGTYYVGAWLDGYRVAESTVNLTGDTDIILDINRVVGFNKAYKSPVYGGPGTWSPERLVDGGRYGGDSASAVDTNAFGNATEVTATVLTDSSKMWIPNQLVGMTLGARPGGVYRSYTIASNTETTITIASGNMVADGLTAGTFYWIGGSYTPEPCWLAVDLGENRAINQILIDWFPWTIPGKYKIQYAVDDGMGMMPEPDSSDWRDWYVCTATKAFNLPSGGDTGPYGVIYKTAAVGRWWRIWTDVPPRVGDPPVIPMMGIREMEIYSAEEVPAALSGVVKNPAGQPIYNAIVHLEGPKEGNYVTDTDGVYVFSQLPTDQGQYWIAADAPGYSIKETQVVLLPGEIRQLDITLQPNPSETNLVYNGAMEEPDGTLPKGWMAFPDNAEGLSYYRYTGDNHTPGGTASFACSRPSGAVGQNVAAMAITPDKWVRVDPSKSYNIYFWVKADEGVGAGAYSAVWRDSMGNEISRLIYPGWFAPFQTTWKAFPIAWKAVPPVNAAYLDIHVVAVLPDNNPTRRLYADDVVVDATTSPAFPPSNRIGDAKGMVGTEVALYSKVISGVSGSNGIPADCIYVEEGDRSSGILVGIAGAVKPESLAVGQLIDVTGLVVFTPEGEPCITADYIRRPDQGAPVDLRPLGMTVRSAATAPLSLGLLVTIGGYWYFEGGDIWISDGSTSGPIRVEAPGMGMLPPSGSYVRATGILGIGWDGNRCLRIRSEDDVTNWLVQP